MGNYFSSGGMKFIPELTRKQFLMILRSHPLMKEKNGREAVIYKTIV
jgi:hypothetical protein